MTTFQEPLPEEKAARLNICALESDLWGLAKTTSFVDTHELRRCWEVIDRLDLGRFIAASYCVSVPIAETYRAAAGVRTVCRYHLELFCDARNDRASILASVLAFCGKIDGARKEIGFVSIRARGVPTGGEITPASLSDPQSAAKLERLFAGAARPLLSLVVVQQSGECLLEFALQVRLPLPENPQQPPKQRRKDGETEGQLSAAKAAASAALESYLRLYRSE